VLPDSCKLVFTCMLKLMFEIYYFSDSSSGSLNQSALHPYTTKAPVLVRFSSSPVYALNDTSNENPIAVLMLGDIANGKFNVIDIANDQYGNGRKYRVAKNADVFRQLAIQAFTILTNQTEKRHILYLLHMHQQ
jgi:hypothetical protein